MGHLLECLNNDRGEVLVSPFGVIGLIIGFLMVQDTFNANFSVIGASTNEALLLNTIGLIVACSVIGMILDVSLGTAFTTYGRVKFGEYRLIGYIRFRKKKQSSPIN